MTPLIFCTPPEIVRPPLPLMTPAKIFPELPAVLVSVWLPSVTMPSVAPNRLVTEVPAFVAEMSKVAIAEREPRLAAELGDGLESAPRLVGSPPATLFIGDTGERVENAVEVG